MSPHDPHPAPSNNSVSSVSWSQRVKNASHKIYHHARKHTGVGVVCAVAYFDP